MVDPVDDPTRRSGLVAGDEAAHGFGGIEQAGESEARGLFRQFGFVECQIGPPQRRPVGKIRFSQFGDPHEVFRFAFTDGG